MTLTTEPLPRDLWYMASTYTAYPGPREEAFKLACKKAGELMVQGYVIFCPIAHSHPIEIEAHTPGTHDFWLGQDVTFLNLATGMFFYKLPGWEKSFGCNWEAAWMKAHDKPVIDIPWEG